MPNKILVVDDDENIRKTLRRNLKRAGYEVFEAENGEEALQSVSKLRPDVVLLDVMMPVMSGIIACQNLRSDLRNNVIFIIMLTARAESEVTGLDAGADDYVTKPFDFEKLLARVRMGLRTVKEKQLSIMDSITGLYNREFFQNLLDMELDRSRRYGRELSLILFSLDGLDLIEAPDHDSVLTNVAHLLRIRKSDIAARWGEREFVLLLPETGSKGASLIAERLLREISRHDFPCGGKLNVNFGVASIDYTQDIAAFAENFLMDAQEFDGNTIVSNAQIYEPQLKQRRIAGE